MLIVTSNNSSRINPYTVNTTLARNAVVSGWVLWPGHREP